MMDEFEFLLEDRIAKIQAINEQYDLENNAYISFSGGKDSTVLHYLIDLALPNNRIPRVFLNTGIEYLEMVKFVKSMASNDDRFILIAPSQNIKKILDTYGYPFKSKEHSLKVSQYKRGFKNPSNIQYRDGIRIDKNFNPILDKHGKPKKPFILCPKILKYQFEDDFTLNISDKCCHKLKKEPAAKWSKENGKSILLTGMRKEEGGQRTSINCIVTKKEKLVKFHPLLVVSEEWENQFIDRFNIQLYYPPYNFERTGCKGCPFSLKLQEQLDVMAKHLPKEKEHAELIWKPVYEEYRRIGYRLRPCSPKKDEYYYEPDNSGYVFIPKGVPYPENLDFGSAIKITKKEYEKGRYDISMYVDFKYNKVSVDEFFKKVGGLDETI